MCYPHTDKHNAPVCRFRTITYQPLPDEAIRKYGQWITSGNFVINRQSTSDYAEKLQQLLIGKLEQIYPVKTKRVSFPDKPFINKELKTLDRRKQREYVKKGKSVKYNRLKEEFDRKYKTAAESYMRNKVDDLKEAQPGRAYNILKTMGAQPGDCTDDQSFSLPEHQTLNLTDEQCAERREFSPLNKSHFPDRVKSRLIDGTNPPTYL